MSRRLFGTESLIPTVKVLDQMQTRRLSILKPSHYIHSPFENGLKINKAKQGFEKMVANVKSMHEEEMKSRFDNNILVSSFLTYL